MNRTTLKDAQLRIVGYIDTQADGRQTARDRQLRIAGYYDPHSNITRDSQLRLVGYGNALAMLIGCRNPR